MEQTLENPDKIELDKNDDTLVHNLKTIEEFDGRILRIVYNKSGLN